MHTDDSNGAINANGRWMCATCFEAATGKHVPTDADGFKARLLERLRRLMADGVETVRLDGLEHFIRGFK
jgi:hypothetical protein